MAYQIAIGIRSYRFDSLLELMAKSTPLRTGDALAGIAAGCAEEAVAARMALAEVPLSRFCDEWLIEPSDDEVSALIERQFDRQAFVDSGIASCTVGGFRDWLLSDLADTETLAGLSRFLMPEMAAAVCKLMRNQDLILVASKIRNRTSFRNSLGGKGIFSTRLQPNHPNDDVRGIAASIMDGLMFGSGDACIGINPVSDDPASLATLWRLLDELIARFEIPTQSCVLAHLSRQIAAINSGVPVDLVFQSIGGTQAVNESFGISLAMLEEAQQAALSLDRGTLGHNVMYFETGQGSALSANAHHGVDQQTLEVRAYAVAREHDPLLVNTVVGFIGPEYLYDGKQIARAALEDHFCGKLLGLPMGVDVCHTNHAEADQDDMDSVLTLLATAGCNYIMGVPGSDDVMLNYQSTSFHDAHYIRRLLNMRPAPEFEVWLKKRGIVDETGGLMGPQMDRALTDLQSFLS